MCVRVLPYYIAYIKDGLKYMKHMLIGNKDVCFAQYFANIPTDIHTRL